MYMVLYHVLYEYSNFWFTAGFVFAKNSTEAIESVKKHKRNSLIKKLQISLDEYDNELNFDCSPVITTDGEIIQR